MVAITFFDYGDHMVIKDHFEVLQNFLLLYVDHMRFRASNLSSDIINKTKYEKLFLLPLPLRHDSGSKL